MELDRKKESIILEEYIDMTLFGDYFPSHLPFFLTSLDGHPCRGSRLGVTTLSQIRVKGSFGLISTLNGSQGYKTEFLAKYYCSFPFLILLLSLIFLNI